MLGKVRERELCVQIDVSIPGSFLLLLHFPAWKETTATTTAVAITPTIIPKMENPPRPAFLCCSVAGWALQGLKDAEAEADMLIAIVDGEEDMLIAIVDGVEDILIAIPVGV